jgi:SPP1 gp7 family putative phage head morphogenesis protein
MSRPIPRLRRDQTTSQQTRKKASRKVPRALYPHGLELDYYRFLLAEVRALFASIDRVTTAHLDHVLSRYARVRRPRADALADDLDRLFAPLLARWGARANALRTAIAEFATRTAAFNLVQFRRQTKAVLGVDVLTREPWLHDELALFTRENVALIKGIGETAIARVERTVTEGVRRGLATKAIQDSIQEDLGVTERRAKLIAVDQVGKLNGLLSQQRQKDAGIEEYTWRTCQDRRVRPAHRAREGRRFRWDAPPPDGNPGEPIRCRCIAEPVLDLFSDLMPSTDAPDWAAIGTPTRRRN